MPMRIVGSTRLNVRKIGQLACQLNMFVKGKAPDDIVEADLRLDGMNLALLLKQDGKLVAQEEIGRLK